MAQNNASAEDITAKLKIPGGHFGVEADLDTRLNLVLALDEQIEKLLRVDDRFAEVGHQPDQRRVPFIHDLEDEMWRRKSSIYFSKPP